MWKASRSHPKQKLFFMVFFQNGLTPPLPPNFGTFESFFLGPVEGFLALETQNLPYLQFSTLLLSHIGTRSSLIVDKT